MNISRHSIDNVPRYYEAYTNDCFQNAYGVLVSYMKLNPRLVLSDYLSFMYDHKASHIGINFLHRFSHSFEFSEEQLNTSYEYVYFPAVSHFSSHNIMDANELSEDKIKISLYIEDDPDIAHSRMLELIDKDMPVVVLVDMYHMTYHRAYHKEHGAHAVVITGYNEEEGYVELFDKYQVSKSDFDGRFPIEELMLARSSENFLGSCSKPIKNMWMEISKSDRFYYNDMRWKAILEESCSRMNGEKTILGCRCGLDQIEELRRDLLVKKESIPEEEVFSLFKDYFNTSFKSISRSRVRFCIFLDEIALFLPYQLAEEVSTDLRDSARKWEVISNLSLRLALTKNINTLDSICKHLELIKETESRAVEKLQGYVKTGGC